MNREFIEDLERLTAQIGKEAEYSKSMLQKVEKRREETEIKVAKLDKLSKYFLNEREILQNAVKEAKALPVTQKLDPLLSI